MLGKLKFPVLCLLALAALIATSCDPFVSNPQDSTLGFAEARATVYVLQAYDGKYGKINASGNLATTESTTATATRFIKIASGSGFKWQLDGSTSYLMVSSSRVKIGTTQSVYVESDAGSGWIYITSGSKFKDMADEVGVNSSSSENVNKYKLVVVSTTVTPTPATPTPATPTPVTPTPATPTPATPTPVTPTPATPTPVSSAPSGVLRTITVASTAELHTALKGAKAGDRILIKAGTYTGSSTTSGYSNAMFYGYANGTAANPIYLESETTAVTLQGTSTGSKYVFYLTGDYWNIKNIKFKTGMQGIMADNSSRCTYSGLEISNIGQEGLHLRDGSSYNLIDNCYVHDTGKTDTRYGEGFYVGSDVGKWSTYKKECDYNTIRNSRTAYTTAESIDIKEGTTGTIVEYCTFSGVGMSDSVNGGDSYIDVKGNDVIVRYNTGTQNGGRVLDAFSTNAISGYGLRADFHHNTITFDSGNTSSYIIYVRNSATCRASQNTRSPSGNMYTSGVTVY